MNSLIRQQLIRRLTQKAGIADTAYTFKHCAQIANEIDCDANSVARLFGISSFKATQCLKPEIERKLADFLGYPHYEALEEALMHDIVWLKFQNYCKERSG